MMRNILVEWEKKMQNSLHFKMYYLLVILTFVNSIAKSLLHSVSISMLQKISSCTILRAPGGNKKKNMFNRIIVRLRLKRYTTVCKLNHK